MKGDSRDSLAWKAMVAWPQDVWAQEKLKRKAKQAVDLAERAAKVVVKSVENGKKLLDNVEDINFKTETHSMDGISVHPVPPPGLSSFGIPDGKSLDIPKSAHSIQDEKTNGGMVVQKILGWEYKCLC